WFSGVLFSRNPAGVRGQNTIKVKNFNACVGYCSRIPAGLRLNNSRLNNTRRNNIRETPMIRVRVKNEKQQQDLEHQGSALEFGRGPQRNFRRVVVDDVFCSRDQLRIEELPGSRLRLENLSSKNAVTLSTGTIIAVGTT